MKLNRKWLLVIALVTSLVMATAGTLAYLTDRDTVENTFTMGKVEIKVEEVFPEGGAPIKPGETVNKNARITNSGSKDAWVWMTVSVSEELKDYVTLNWFSNADEVSGPAIIDGKAVWTAFVNEQLPAGEATGYLLDSVTLSPYVDYQGGKYVVVKNGQLTDLKGLENGNLNVTVTGYAVQADGIASAKAAYMAYAGQWGLRAPAVPTATYNGKEYLTIYDAVAAANQNGGGRITLSGSATLDKPVEITSSITIDGAGISAYTREDGFTGTMFLVKAGATLTAENVVFDGAGATATGNLIATEGNGSIVLNAGTVVQNNNGAHAVNLATRGGGTLTLNGASIINNSSDSGAIWGGGHIIINEGSKINNNSSTGSAGAIRMVGKCNLTMNGGEICGNVAAADGGAIWGYGVNGNTSVYNLNSGRISGNTAGGTGGGIYTGTYSEVYISGDFEMCNNTAADSGAMRVTNYTIVNMTGGKISGNVSTNNSACDGFYSWCPRMTLGGGELADNIYVAGGHTPTIGACEITGIVHFDIGTNHNTVNLAADFKGFKFKAAEGANFAAFNLKPASGYTYTAGDETKLVCMNEGYSTYWDAADNTFRLQAN